MSETKIIEQAACCYHCGEDFESERIQFDEQEFCCTGCKTVYELLKDNDLCAYYDLNDNAGISLKSKNFDGKYDYLNSKDVVSKLIDFQNETVIKVSLYIPSIHCSSCVWLLENFSKITEGVFNSRLNFVKKTLSITFNPKSTSLKTIVELLATLGYEPYISFADEKEGKNKSTPKNHLIRQIAVVGFCMGNIMLLSFPEYFNVAATDTKYALFFLYLNFALSIPVYFYGGWDYLKGSFTNIRSILKKETDVVSIDLPIAIGISALFIRSSIETIFYQSAGYWDSLAGLVFFLLVGKWIQKKTFDFLTFERTFKSYFPLAVFVKNRNRYENIAEIAKGDTILCKNGEVIPADGVIINGTGRIDYSFVTGEAENTKVLPGEAVFAGGRQVGDQIEIKVTKAVNNSYLTQLWNDASFKKEESEYGTKLSQGFIKYFTLVTLGIAFVTGIYWYQVDSTLIWPTVTAVLMVACPCALTLSMPFTMGTVMGILGKNKFFVRSQEVIQELNEIDDVVFDKTGTLTSNNKQKVSFSSAAGDYNSTYLKGLAHTLASRSSHPLSKAIANFTTDNSKVLNVLHYEEVNGKGIMAIVDGYEVKLGSQDFIGCETIAKQSVYLAIDGQLVGYFEINSDLRQGTSESLNHFAKSYKIHLLSGDNSKSKSRFEPIFGSEMYFNQKPEDKLAFISGLREQDKSVLMIGDGLNDAGALQQSDVGIVVSEDTNRFSPACDAILDASVFHKLKDFIGFSKTSINIVKLSFLLSVVYNFIGISWAVSGTLSPVLAAIFMPISSISVVLFAVVTTYATAYYKNLLNTKSWI